MKIIIIIIIIIIESKPKFIYFHVELQRECTHLLFTKVEHICLAVGHMNSNE